MIVSNISAESNQTRGSFQRRRCSAAVAADSSAGHSCKGSKVRLCLLSCERINWSVFNLPFPRRERKQSENSPYTGSYAEKLHCGGCLITEAFESKNQNETFNRAAHPGQRLETCSTSVNRYSKPYRLGFSSHLVGVSMTKMNHSHLYEKKALFGLKAHHFFRRP